MITSDDLSTPPTCATVRDALEARHDGVPVDTPGLDDDWIDAHLAGCPACAAHRDDLVALRMAIRSLPLLAGPVVVLPALARTTADAAPRPDDRTGEPTGPPDRQPRRSAFRLPRAALATAAVLAILAGAAWFARPPATAPDAADTEDIARLEAEAERVLLLVSSTLHRTERAAIGDALTERTAPLLGMRPLADFD